ncbi:hypothetical protein L6164_016908 [Bauhinia variegata]|uniref:Uncharacterized protein n=1 Tax=Bauhinia variegata TaxID=167791 RepID=A0ACB9N645_BAUVA|nr:hypothetical protein L6164_016908 [Bauhinia variegata]
MEVSVPILALIISLHLIAFVLALAPNNFPARWCRTSTTIKLTTFTALMRPRCMVSGVWALAAEPNGG